MKQIVTLITTALLLFLGSGCMSSKERISAATLIGDLKAQTLIRDQNYEALTRDLVRRYISTYQKQLQAELDSAKNAAEAKVEREFRLKTDQLVNEIEQRMTASVDPKLKSLQQDLETEKANVSRGLGSKEREYSLAAQLSSSLMALTIETGRLEQNLREKIDEKRSAILTAIREVEVPEVIQTPVNDSDLDDIMNTLSEDGASFRDAVQDASKALTDYISASAPLTPIKELLRGAVGDGLANKLTGVLESKFGSAKDKVLTKFDTLTGQATAPVE